MERTPRPGKPLQSAGGKESDPGRAPGGQARFGQTTRRPDHAPPRQSPSPALFSLFLAASWPPLRAGVLAGEPIVLENTKGNFDFIRVDPAQHRLLLAHTGNKTLDVFDLESKMLFKSVPTGPAQDSAIDAKNPLY